MSGIGEPGIAAVPYAHSISISCSCNPAMVTARSRGPRQSGERAPSVAVVKQSKGLTPASRRLMRETEFSIRAILV